MRRWHRFFFVNRRRLRNFISAGAIDASSDAPRLVGMPKVDCLVDGSLRRDDGPARPSARSRPADDSVRADVVGGLVAEPDGPRARRGAAGAILERDRQAPRSVAAICARSTPAASTGRPVSDASSAGKTGRLASGRGHLSVSRGGRRDDHRSQLGGLRIPPARPPARPDSRAGAPARLEHQRGVRAPSCGRGAVGRRPDGRAAGRRAGTRRSIGRLRLAPRCRRGSLLPARQRDRRARSTSSTTPWS